MRTFRYILSLLAATLALLAQPAMAQAPETSTKAQPSDPVFPYLLTIQQPAEGATLDVMIMNAAGTYTAVSSGQTVYNGTKVDLFFAPQEGYRLTEGSITYNGEELIGKPINAILAAGIAQVPEGRRVFPDMTVLENLKIGAYLRKDKEEIEKDIEWVYELFPRLKERNWQLAGTLSGGEQQMLAVGRGLMSRPKVLMMDEPSLGLAPLVVQGIFDIIREINRQGVTILLIEQNANMALKIADLAYVLETGTITMSGTGAELLADEKVKEAYLGKKRGK